MSISFIWSQAKVLKVNLTDFKGYGLLLCFGSSLAFACNWFQMISFQYISITKSTLIIYSNPVVVVILAYFILKEKVTKHNIIVVTIVLVG